VGAFTQLRGILVSRNRHAVSVAHHYRLATDIGVSRSRYAVGSEQTVSPLEAQQQRHDTGHLEKSRCPVLIEWNISGLRWGQGPQMAFFKVPYCK
jgi:hypothetical protein